MAKLHLIYYFDIVVISIYISYFRCSGIKLLELLAENVQCFFVQSHPVAHAELEVDFGKASFTNTNCMFSYEIMRKNHKYEIQLNALLTPNVPNMFGGYHGYNVEVSSF